MPDNSSHEQENPLRTLIAQRSATEAKSPYLLAAGGGRTLTFEELAEKNASVNEALVHWGMKSGDRVGLVVSDPLVSAQWLLSLIAMGVWVAPLDPTILYSSASQVDDRGRLLGLRAIVADRTLSFDTDTPWLALHDPASWQPPSANDARRSAHAGGIVLSSSGTTGTPKVMELSNRQLLETARTIARHNELTQSDRGFNPLPLWHVNAIVVGLLSTLVSGASLVLDDRFHRTDFWATVARSRATWINAVPAIIARLSELHEGETVPGGLRFVRSASAPLSGAQLERFEATTGVPVLESYGMTEAASQICANPLRGPRKVGSVGVPVGVQVRVVDLEAENAAHVVEPNMVGHVEIRGSSVIDHYESPGYEDRFDHENWLRTGDVGYLDDDGYVFLVGRIDDVINRGGEKIMPRELEDAALGVEGVLTAVVVAREHDVYGQVPELFVQLRDVTPATTVEHLAILTKELNDVLVNTFSRARRPVAINVVEAMPVHATGKVQRKGLTSGQVNVLYQQSVS